ncbi:MAG: GTP 3',8-cyclase MoaA [Thermoplasmata archaeon]
MLFDNYGRPLNSLRIQVNAVCNFKCFFCHMEGTEENAEHLSPEEIEEVVRIASLKGVNRIKFTGGEPLIRRDLEEIITRTRKHIKGDISLTTNGFFLESRAKSLKEAGLDRINISLHSLHKNRFRIITGNEGISSVEKGIDAALEAGLKPVKINFVVLNGLNTDEIDEMMMFAAEKGAILQLIEYETDRNGENTEDFRRYHYDLRNIEKGLKDKIVGISYNSLHHRKKYRVNLGSREVEVELVMPMRNPDFCNNCTRLRVTSKGQFQTCLNRKDQIFSFRGEKNIEKIMEEAVKAREPYWR